MSTIPKVVKDGQVAVLIAPNYGAGWSTWADPDIAETMMFDPDLVAWVSRGKKKPEPDIDSKYGEFFYSGGLGNLTVVWVPEGTEFLIQEYDGAESILYKSTAKWVKA